MRLTLPEPKIRIGEDGFDGIDKLGRAPLAHQLTDLVDRIDDPITIALDGGWGSGKSFFLKLWIGEHSNPPIGRPKGKARMIYFDAFEHDFLDDPLVGLVGAIAEDEETTTKSGSSINSLKKWAWKLAKPVARAGLFAITSGVSEVVGAVGDAVIKVASEEAEQTLEQFWAKEDDKRAAMKGFRAALTALTTPDETGTPTQKIVLIIDELDRCRPDYALSMLETIKHFFAVPGVHFVLGVNMAALANSVKARYGARTNADEYLQKFVHLSVGFSEKITATVNASAVNAYWRHGAAELGLGEGMKTAVGLYIDVLSRHRGLSLRQSQRILTYAVLASDELESGLSTFRYLIAGAIFLKVVAPDAYRSLQNGTLSFSDFLKCFFHGEPLASNVRVPEDWLWIIWQGVLEEDRATDSAKLSAKEAIGLVSEPTYLKWLQAKIRRHLETFTLPPDPA